MWFKSSFTTPAVAAISFCLIGGTVPAATPVRSQWGQIHKLTAAVSASGGIAVIGSVTDDDAGASSGAAYVF